MSSSDEELVTRTNRHGYKIDLQAFSKSRVRLETELRDQSKAIEILDTYCSDGGKYNEINPFLNPDGANPLLRTLYKHNASGDISAPWGKCELTDQGAALKSETQHECAENSMETTYGDSKEPGSFPSPAAIHYWPAKAWRTLNAYYIAEGSTDIFTTGNWKKLSKEVKQWLKQTHRIWSKIVNRLPTSGIHLTGGIEMSNGVQLYSNLLHRYGHTHAQCLAQLLRILANIELMKTDPATGKKETIRDYFSRGQRIARMARDFPAMKFPIAGPLLKVMLLEGLNRSDQNKYGQVIISAYANDLADDLEKIQATMETVEGLRAEQIKAEYAPTSLASADVSYGGGASDRTGRGNPLDPTNKPEEPCNIPGHVGHSNKQCRTKWGDRAVKYRGRKPNTNPRNTANNRHLCRYFLANQKCPFQPNCKFSHSMKQAKTYLSQFVRKDGDEDEASFSFAANTKPYSFIIETTDDESSGNE